MVGLLRSFASSISCFSSSFPLRACATVSRWASVQQWKRKSLFNTSVVRQYSGVVVKQCQPLVTTNLRAYPLLIPRRNLVKCSKRKGKRKTVKAVAKRFYRTGSGKLKYWPAGNNHKMLSKGFNERRNLRKPRYATKKQLKVLNQMISGW